MNRLEHTTIKCTVVTRFATYGLFLLLAVITTPSPLFPAAGGLDPGWILGLHLAVAKGMVFGRDVMFTYGPLGFLLFPVIVKPEYWILSVVFVNVVNVAFFMSLAIFALQSENRVLSTMILGIFSPIVVALLSLTDTLGYQLVLVLFLLSYLLSKTESKTRYLQILIAVAAVAVYVKTDVGLLSVAVVLVAAICTYRREIRCILSTVTLFLAVLFAAGMLLTGGFWGFFNFMIGYSQLALGYGVMSYDTSLAWLLFFPLIGLFGYVLFLLWAGRNLLRFFCIAAPFLFLTFKHGFVRPDQHVIGFFACCGFFFLVLTCLIKPGMRPKILALLIATFLIMSGIGAEGVIMSVGSLGTRSTPAQEWIPLAAESGFAFVSDVYGGRICTTYVGGLCVRPMSTDCTRPTSFGMCVRSVTSRRVPNLVRTAIFLAQPSVAQERFNNSVEALRQTFGKTPSYYSLSPATLSLLDGHSVDVLPWDITLAYVYGLDWAPAPVFQSYSAYTPYLDRLNAGHYDGSASPDFVLYSFGSLDTRYPAFEEPFATRAFLCNYDRVGRDGAFLIFEKSLNACAAPQFISSEEVSFGEAISIPRDKLGSVIGVVRIEENWLGTIQGLIYKVPTVTVKLEFDDGSSGMYRFVTATGADGLLLNGPLLNKISNASVTRMTYYTTDKNEYSNIRIEFLRVPALRNN